jgi:hypothetical protein
VLSVRFLYSLYSSDELSGSIKTKKTEILQNFKNSSLSSFFSKAFAEKSTSAQDGCLTS